MRTRGLLLTCMVSASLFVSSRAHALAGDGVWSPLGTGTGNSVSALTVYNGSLIAGGLFQTAGGQAANRVARWNGTSWSPLGVGIENGFNFATVDALTVYNGSLIAGGDFDFAGSVAAASIARWDGAEWHALGTGLPGAGVTALTIYNGQLIASGYFSTAGGVPANRIASWNGSAWSPLGAGLDDDVSALAVYNGELIAAGRFLNAGGVGATRIARWNGSVWAPLGSGTDDAVRALSVVGTNLFAAGEFTSAGGQAVLNVAQWNGSHWSALGEGLYEVGASALSFENTLIVGRGTGRSSPGGFRGTPSRWNGSAWSLVGAGVDDFGKVLAMTVYNESLVIAGDFLGVAGIPANRVAIWNGQSAVNALFQNGFENGATGQPPVIAGLVSSLSLLEDQGSSALAFTLSDPDTSVNALVLSASSNAPALIAPPGGTIFGGSGANRTLTLSPEPNQNGAAAVTVTVSDGANSAATAINVSVTAVNDAPSLNWSTTCVVSNGGTWTPENGPTPAQFTYPAGTQSTQNCLNFLVVTMGPPNESAQSLSAANITQVSNPAIFAEQPQLVLNGLSAHLSFRPNGSAGTADISVRVTDNGGTANGGTPMSAVRVVRVVVNGAAPTLTPIADQTINEDSATSALAFTIGDSDTPIAALSLAAFSANTSLIPNANLIVAGSGTNRTLTAMPSAHAFGATTITLTVSDGSQQTQRSFMVTVNPVNDAPSFSHAGDVILASGAVSGIRQISGWATNLSVGPANEAAAGQVPDQFVLTRLDSNVPNIIATAPTVSVVNGRLTFSLQNAGGGVTADGYACYRVVLLDSGSSAAPNVNQSAPALLKIQVGPGSQICSN